MTPNERAGRAHRRLVVGRARYRRQSPNVVVERLGVRLPDRQVLPGAEPFSAGGGPNGVLLIHGFTGTPHSMRGLADSLVAAGFTVQAPLLPGHGTSIEDMLTTGWRDWSSATEAAYRELAGRCEKVVVAGLSMGGTLTVWLAERHPEIAAIVAINPAIDPPAQSFRDMVSQLIDEGHTTFPAIGNDIADPNATELAYDAAPLCGLLSLCEGDDEVVQMLGEVTCPVLVVTSVHDHVVPPVSSDILAAGVSGPVERLMLEGSFHVATLDYDKHEVERAVVAFAHRHTAS